MTLLMIKYRKQTWHLTSIIHLSHLMTSIFDLALWYQIPSLYSVQFFFMTNESLEWQTDYQRIHMVRWRCWRGSGPRWWASQSSRHTAAAADLPGSGTSRPIKILYRNIIHFSFVDENCLYMYIKCYNITCSFNFYMQVTYMYIPWNHVLVILHGILIYHTSRSIKQRNSSTQGRPLLRENINEN